MKVKIHDRIVALCVAVPLFLAGCYVPSGSSAAGGSGGRNALPVRHLEIPSLSLYTPDENLVTDTGKPGPGGGTIIDMRDSGLGYDLEVRPYTANTALMYSQASTLNPGFPGTAWRLPDHAELLQIYYLYLARGKITLEQFSPLSHDNGNVIWTRSEADATHAVALLLVIRAVSADSSVFNTNFESLSKSMLGGACYVRDIPVSQSYIQPPLIDWVHP